MPSPNPPKVFISYCHEDSDHNNWVENLATALRKAGIESILDKWNSPLGTDINRFMEKSTKCDRVIVVCTPRYAQKANSRKGGVGIEAAIISASMYETLSSHVVIPVLRKGNWDTAVPVFMKGRTGVNFTTQSDISSSFKQLVEDIHGLSTMQAPDISPYSSTNEDLREITQILLNKKTSSNKKGAPSVTIQQTMARTKKAKKTPKSKIKGTAGITSNGCIMVADITNFSSVSRKDVGTFQKDAVAGISKYFWEAIYPKLKKALGGNDINAEVFFMKLLDGAVIVCRQNLYSEFVEISKQWIDYMKTSCSFPVELRIGLHKGNFFVGESSQKPNSSSHIFGTGPNDCDRIARVGDAYNIFASEEFIQEWRGIDSAEVAKLAFPQIGTEAVTVHKKNGKPQLVRFIRRENSGSEEPSYLRKKAMIDDRVHQMILPDLYYNILGYITEKYPKKIKRLSTYGLRVSYYIPSYGNASSSPNYLNLFTRYCGEDELSNICEVNGTTYNILKEKPEGPVGLCYKSYIQGSPKLITQHDLPDPKKKKKEWENAMTLKFNLPKSKVSTMHYRARAFITVPVVFSREELEPLGVLCVDFAHPLTFFSQQFITELAEDIFNDASALLAPLWMLRI